MWILTGSLENSRGERRGDQNHQQQHWLLLRICSHNLLIEEYLIIETLFVLSLAKIDGERSQMKRIVTDLRKKIKNLHSGLNCH